MKKIFLIITIALCAALCACANSAENNTVENAENSENTEGTESDEITFSADDLALFSTQGIGKLLVNLYMKQDELPYDDEEVGDMLNSFNIGFQEINGENKVNYIYLSGSPIPVQTVKGIYTTGITYLDEQLCSDEEDVINNYGLDEQQEEIYVKLSESSESNFIATFFTINNDGNVVRNKYPKGTDISDFSALDSNVYIYFEIMNSKVVGIIMGCK